ncbi:MAG: hypothetical protein ACREIF_18885 [Chthoniobacterales bacterium]
MKIQRRFVTLMAAISLFGVTLPAGAADFGDAKDVKQVRKIVATKFGHALHASVSHDWALCTGYNDESSVSVVLHRTAAGWKIVESDGGAYVAEILSNLGVPGPDIAPLLKAYQ